MNLQRIGEDTYYIPEGKDLRTSLIQARQLSQLLGKSIIICHDGKNIVMENILMRYGALARNPDGTFYVTEASDLQGCLLDAYAIACATGEVVVFWFERRFLVVAMNSDIHGIENEFKSGSFGIHSNYSIGPCKM